MAAENDEIALQILSTGKTCTTAVDGDPAPLLGYSADDLLSHRVSLFDRIHPDDMDLAALLADPGTNSRSGRICLRIRHADNRIRCLETEFQWDASRVAIRMRRPNAARVADAILHPQGWLDVTIAGIQEGIIIKDYNHVYIAASPEFRSRIAHIVGNRNVVGMTDYDWLPESIADKFYSLEKRVLNEGIQLEQIVEHEERWIHARYTPVKAPAGDISGLFVWNQDVTESVRNEEKIDPQDRSVGARIAAQMGTYTYDVQRRRFALSSNLQAIFGLHSHDSHDVDTWNSLIHPEDFTAIANHAREMYEHPGRMFSHEYRIIRRSDQQIRWVHAIGQVVRHATTGEPFLIHGTIQDITDRKLTEAALRETQQRLQLFIEHAPAALAMFDREMRYMAVSQRWLELEHKTLDIVGRCHYDVVPDIPEHFKEAHRRGLAGESLHNDDERFERADGSITWLHWEVLPWRDAEGAVGGIILFTEDITERKRTEAALRESEAKYRRIVSTANEGVLVVGADYNTESINQRFAEMLGYAVEEICGRPFSEFMFEEDLPDHMLKIANRAKGISEHYERRFRRKDGQTLWTLVSAVPILDEQQRFQGSFAMFADITERKQRDLRLEYRVAERTTQLQEANRRLKMANHELEAFTYSVSHDLRAPLRHIGSFSHLLNEIYAAQLPSEAREYLNKIEQSTRRMGQLIDDLLNLARVGRNALAFRPIDLNALVSDVRHLLQVETHGRNVEWRVDELPVVTADVSLLTQVYQNLVGNALKFTRSRNPAVIEVSSKMVKGKRVFFVRDNGVGFDMQYSDKLFEAFQRLHSRGQFEGTGIGLATVHRIVQKHGGVVWAEAEIDKGATFYFTLGSNVLNSDPSQDVQTAGSSFAQVLP